MPRPPARSRIVTILGDSITAGLRPARVRDSLPAQAGDRALDRLGARHGGCAGPASRGDTSGRRPGPHGLQRPAPTPAVCVVALGGNDLLQGADPSRTKANLKRIIEKLKARRIRVVLAGVRAPPLIGASYARDFTGLYPALARETGVVFHPDFVTGVVGAQRLMQRDGIHPNAAGARVIAERLAPTVASALRTAI